MNRRFLSAVALLVLAATVCITLGRSSAEGEAPSAASDNLDAASGSGVTAYYFHTSYRCATCRTIEALSQEAITKGFPDELARGRMAWRAVSVEQPENRHFIQDFQLVTKSLVLVEEREGKVVRFKNLDRVWLLVRDRQRFLDYVRSETRAFLGAS